MTYQKGIEISFVTDFKKFEAMVDPEALNKIISSPLINAFKFARKKNEIRFKTDVQKLISIAVVDDDIGIPKNQIDFIFTKFFQVNTAEHNYNNLGGSGIGLALAKSLVEKHEGSLTVESEQNFRTTFTVLLPF